MASSKSEYLKKYLSQDTRGSVPEKKKKRRKIIKKHSANVIIHDDDVDWKTIVPKTESTDDEDPEDAPIIAEMYEEDGKRDARWKLLQEVAADEFPQIVKTEPMSPPLYETSSEFHGKLDSPDVSPPRRHTRHDSPDISPPRRHTRHDSPDINPPRRRTRHDSPDVNPPRRHTRRDSPDISPPRRGARHDSPDVNPPRRRIRHNSPDISPPRRRTRHDSPDITPPRKHTRHDSPDISPPRRGTRHDSPDVSPPRRGTRHDVNPPRRGTRHDSPDISPPRRGTRPLSSDINPQRRDRSPPRNHRPSTDRNQNQMSVPKTGLQSGQSLKDELLAAKKAKELYYRNMDTKLSGRNAETVFRDKEGRRKDPKKEKKLTKEEEEKKREDDLRFAQWGRGIAQVKSAQQKAADDLYEMSKPLARYRDDEDLEILLKEKERDGDPMLAFIQNKTKVIGKNGKPKKVRPMYKRSYPLNRYGIRPGFRWDGIDRSNGHEKLFFAKKAQTKAIKEDAYKWSVEDM